MQAEALLREGRLDDSLRELESSIRKNPADAKLRVFLFQLLCVRGDWDRALTQLNVAAEMDPTNLLMAEVCRPALACEKLRAEIFAAEKSPLVMGKPEEWVGWMIQAATLDAQGKHGQAAKLRASALEAAPAASGAIDGAPFEWIADADSRLGPLLEAIVDGRYYWVPFANIARIDLDKPADLRDVVWAPARFTWSNGGQSVGLIPSRYAGTEAEGDSALRLGRATGWRPLGPGAFAGVGQRVFATDAGERGLLETRCITIGAAPPGEAGRG